METYLAGHVKGVAWLRKLLADAKDALAAERAAFDEAHAADYATIQDLTEQLKEAEAALKDEALRKYEATGNKRPADGVQIKVLRRLEYDAGAAYEWAVAHPEKQLLGLDARQYEKQLKAAREHDMPDWADAPGELVETPSAQIASDLSAYLEPEQAS